MFGMSPAASRVGGATCSPYRGPLNSRAAGLLHRPSPGPSLSHSHLCLHPRSPSPPPCTEGPSWVELKRSSGGWTVCSVHHEACCSTRDVCWRGRAPGAGGGWWCTAGESCHSAQWVKQKQEYRSTRPW
ncbi:hypothetical protein OYC64_003258 [Pagothenia borchgrevinki]|uniref:Uncharacterized protein n=1 Tax=Pagothenia borchgrevinki TaxID=8213 RepID=A0ABD2FR53_PAGBO